MDSKILIKKTCAYVQKELENDRSGHDWWHIYRVWSLAKTIAQNENANLTIIELSAILHDIADWKFNNGDEIAGTKKVAKWLTQNGFNPESTDKVCEIISTISYKGAGVSTHMKTLEGKIVQDADRLDAIGAMGIARTFAYGGNKNRLIYHPGQPPVIHQTFEDYKKNNGHTINHFYEKLLLLKNRMNTRAAKKIALKRHKFMENYLKQFFEEWNGNS